MSKARKNIVLVGFSEVEIRSISIPPIGNNYYVDSMEEARKHQGYLIIINNKSNINVVDFDKKYRYIIKKYDKVWLYNEKYKEGYYKFSNIELKNRDIFLYDSLDFWDWYEEYKDLVEKKEEKKYTKKRLDNVNKMYEYLKNYSEIKTSKIANDLGMNERNVERYMCDVNDIYHNVGYDYSLNEWYIIW